MKLIDRTNGRKYQLVKRFVKDGKPAQCHEARTGRRYNLVRVYL